MRQLVERDDTFNQKCVDILVKHKLGFSLPLLEEGRTHLGRLQLEQKTSIPGDALMDLTRRADLSLFHLMSGGSVRMSWALGYKGLIALQKANPETYYAGSVNYFNDKGNGLLFDFILKSLSSHVRRMCQAMTLIGE